VLIAIVTYNGEQYIRKCIDSIKSIEHEVSIFVIDNNSKDLTTQILEKYDFQIKTHLSKSNLGFGQANNIALSYFLENEYDFIFLLNQDTYFIEDSLDSLLNFAIQRNGNYIFSPVHLSRDETNLDFLFQKYLVHDHLENISEQETHTSFINAAAWLMPKSIIEKVGGFSPLFFHYGEDRDYANRLRYNKGKFIVDRNSFIVHDREAKRMKEILSLDKKKYLNRNEIYLLTFASNINEALIKSYFRLLVKGIGEIKNNLFSKNIISVDLVKQLFSMFTLLPKVRAHRKESLKMFAHLQVLITRNKNPKETITK